MKKVLAYFFAVMIMAAVSSCTDPNADELYDLKKTNNTEGVGEQADPEDNEAPGN